MAEEPQDRASRRAKLQQLGVFALFASPCVGASVTTVAREFAPTTLANGLGIVVGVACFIWVCKRMPNDADFR